MKAVAKVGLVGVPPTGAALFFLRPYRWFWRALSVWAVVVATTAVAALVGMFCRF